MAQNIEGTYYLDGLLEGCTSSAEDEVHIRRFVQAASRDGFDYYLKIDRGHFSLLPTSQTCKQKTFDVSVDSRLKRHLETFFEYYSPEECNKFIITLRSVEYLKGFETQAVYGLDSKGCVAVEKRTIETSTVSPQKPLTLKQQLQCYGILAVAIMVVLLISSFFVPYGEIVQSFWGQIRPYDVKQLEVSYSSYSNLIQSKEMTIDKQRTKITLVFVTTPDFPSTKKDLNSQWLASSDDMEKRLIVESIAKNTLRCNLFDKDGKHYYSNSSMLNWNTERTEFSIVLPFDKKLGRIEIHY